MTNTDDYALLLKAFYFKTIGYWMTKTNLVIYFEITQLVEYSSDQHWPTIKTCRETSLRQRRSNDAVTDLSCEACWCIEKG